MKSRHQWKPGMSQKRYEKIVRRQRNKLTSRGIDPTMDTVREAFKVQRVLEKDERS